MISKSDRAKRPSKLRAFLGHSISRYLVAGGLAFLVDFGILALLHAVFGWETWLAAAVAFLVSFAFTYTIQRIFSFGSLAPHGSALVKYTLLVAANTVATTLIVALVDQSPLSWAGGKIIATLVTTVWNYFAYRYWVFAEPKRSAPVTATGGED